MIFLEVRLADGQETIERDVHHLFVKELLGESLWADGIRAPGARQQILLEPRGCRFKRADEFLIGRVEFVEEIGVAPGRLLGPGANCFSEKAGRAIGYANGQIGEFLRRIGNVFPHGLQECRRGLQSVDHGP